MKKGILILFIAFMSCSQKEKNSIIQNTSNSKKWSEYKTIDSIPKLLNLVLIQLNNGEFSIANPNENYNATDVVEDSLPMRQLRLLSKRNNKWRIGYVQGGFGKHYYFAQCEIQNDSIFDFKFSDSSEKLENNDTIDELIKEKKIILRDIKIRFE